jgi:large subunit ribosomal protein L23
MRDPHEIIERPLLTEKSTDQAAYNKFHFRVRLDANKIEIAHAIETIYARDGVKVLAVNTLRVKGKKRRAMSRGAKAGYSPDWKKAIVTTDKPIVLFEGI